MNRNEKYIMEQLAYGAHIAAEHGARPTTHITANLLDISMRQTIHTLAEQGIIHIDEDQSFKNGWWITLGQA